MYLPMINGASEGCLSVGLFILISAAFGNKDYLLFRILILLKGQNGGMNSF